MIVRREQITKMEAVLRRQMAAQMLSRLRPAALPFLPPGDDEALQYIITKIIESNKWGLKTNGQVEQYVTLCASAAELNRKPLPLNLVEQLTWPDRLPEVKLEYLQNELNPERNAAVTG